MRRAGEQFKADVVRRMVEKAMRGKGGILWRVEHLSVPGPDGVRTLIDSHPFSNLWPDGYCLAMLDSYMRNQTQPTTWYVGLKGAGTPAAADTLASHASWSELAGGGTFYDENRVAFAFAAAADQSGTPGITGATPSEFTISTGISSQSVVGAFLSSVATGTAGVLGPVGDFSSSLTVSAGEIVRVTPNVTLDDDAA